MCIGILDEIYMFKSKCLYSENIINTHFESNINVSLRNILIELENERDVIVPEDEVVCRLCIKIPPSGSYIILNETGEEVSHCRYIIQMLLPEININITDTPIICETCHGLLKKYLSLTTSCMDVEQKIKMYCEHQGSDIKEQVHLQCVLQFTENKALDCENSFIGDLVTKQEESSVYVKVEKVEDEEENVSGDLLACGSSSELYFKDEEVEIKSEDVQISCAKGISAISPKEYQPGHEHEHHMGRPNVILQCNDCDYRAKNRSSLSLHKKTHDPTKQKLKCEHCEYSTYLQSSLNQHLVTHTELGETVVYNCATCRFKTKYKYSLTCHEKSCSRKKDAIDSRAMLQCNHCDYRTKNKDYLSLHKKIHDPTKHKFKCEQCEYSTYLRSSLNLHLVTHIELGETAAYYCASCDFKSKYKSSLRDHVKRCSMEKDGVDSRVILQCDQCDFHTKSSSSLNLHKKAHDPTKYKFKCEQCEYCTYRQTRLNQHLMTHKQLGGTKLYDCEICKFKTKHKKSLTNHLKRCSKDGTDSRVLLKCNQCDYRTKNKSCLSLHKKSHDPTKHIFKCEQCEYSTYRHSRLSEHLMTHMELGETVAYNCATCNFKSKYKKSLTDHLKGCSNSTNTRSLMYCCATCNFKSRYKKSLTRHVKCCSKKDSADSRVMLECNRCNFRTTCKKYLSTHKKSHDPTKYKFKCEQCEYCTHDRSFFKRHMLSHTKLGEAVLYYCATCNFKTKYKSNLSHHMKSCSKKKEKNDNKS